MQFEAGCACLDELPSCHGQLRSGRKRIAWANVRNLPWLPKIDDPNGFCCDDKWTQVSLQARGMQAPHVSTCAPYDADCGGEQQSCIIELVPLYSKAARVMEEDAKLTGRSSGCSDYLHAVPVADDPLFIPNWGHPFNLFQISSHHCMKFQGILYSFSSFRSLGLRRHLEEYSGLANIIGGPERDPGMSRKTTTKPPHNRIHQARDENNLKQYPAY